MQRISCFTKRNAPNGSRQYAWNVLFCLCVVDNSHLAKWLGVFTCMRHRRTHRANPAQSTYLPAAPLHHLLTALSPWAGITETGQGLSGCRNASQNGRYSSAKLPLMRLNKGSDVVGTKGVFAKGFLLSFILALTLCHDQHSEPSGEIERRVLWELKSVF